LFKGKFIFSPIMSTEENLHLDLDRDLEPKKHNTLFVFHMPNPSK